MHFNYDSRDWGTERYLVLYDDEGRQLGARDPFWPSGIPGNRRRQQAALRQCRREMLVAEAERRNTTPYPVADAGLRDGALVILVRVPYAYHCGCGGAAVMQDDHAPRHGGVALYPHPCLSCEAKGARQ